MTQRRCSRTSRTGIPLRSSHHNRLWNVKRYELHVCPCSTASWWYGLCQECMAMADDSITSKRTARITKKVQLEELQMVVVCACSPMQGRHGRMLVIVSPRCEPQIAAVEKSHPGRGRRHKRTGGDSSGCYPAAAAAKEATTVRPSPPRQVTVSAPAPTPAVAPPTSLSPVYPASPAARPPSLLLPPPLFPPPQSRAVGRRQDAMAAGGASTGEGNAAVCCRRVVGGAIAAAGTV